MYKTLLGMVNGGFVPTEPSSTKVHNNIDDLILQTELDKFAQTGTVGVDRTPEYIGGTDDIVANVAMSPLLMLKSMGSVGRKLLEKTGLRNPITHYTTGRGVANILKEGSIKGAEGAFPGKPFYKDSRKYLDKQLNKDKSGWLSETDIKFQEQFPKSPSVSVTRDPMFLSRPHGHVGSDIGLIMDRGQLTRQGMKIQPFAEGGYRKLYTPEIDWKFPNVSKVFYKGQQKNKDWLLKKQVELTRQGKDWLKELNKTGLRLEHLGKKFNPRFEFEERIRGYVPTENVRLIDLTRLPSDQSNIDVERFQTLFELAKSKKPIIKSFEAKEGLQRTLNMLNNISRLRLGKGKPFSQYFKEQGINTPDYIQATEQLLDTPTYRFQPFSKVQ